MINTILLRVWSFQLNLKRLKFCVLWKKQTSNEGTFPPVLCGCFFLFFIWKIIFFKQFLLFKNFISKNQKKKQF
jgi:hypothetical protein